MRRAIPARADPDPELPPAQALAASVDAYLGWIEENAEACAKLIQSAGAVPEVRELVERVRSTTADRILEGLGATENPRARITVRGWLWFLDGACLDWIARRDLHRSEVHGVLVGTLAGALLARACSSRRSIRPSGHDAGGTGCLAASASRESSSLLVSPCRLPPRRRRYRR